MRMINHAGLELIKSFEGFRASAYQDSNGKWTIGYGHTAHVNASAVPVSQRDAEVLLQQDLQQVYNAIAKSIGVSLNDNQYAALVSLVFNVGPLPLIRTLGQLLRQGEYNQAANEFLKWQNIAGQSSSGLMRRREAERQLFLTPV